MNPSLYIHIPFCEKKCLFCSFAVAASQMNKRDEYLEALRREASAFKGRAVMSLYVGGGTPSCLECSHIESLSQLVDVTFQFPSDAERTFEVNPESIDERKVEILKSSGFNRLSLGIQSFDDTRLIYLGRPHNASDSRRAFEIVRKAGFHNVSVDLMYGFPGQTEADLKNDLDGIVALNPEHVSLYSLTVEERSLFFARRETVDHDKQGALYRFILKELSEAGFKQYEVSNFAKPGRESVHNINYWLGGEYIGLGMAAHSFLDGKRFWNIDTLPGYLAAMKTHGNPQAGEEELAGPERFMEAFLFALRMNQGVDLCTLERKMNIRFPQEKLDELSNLIEMGLLEEDGHFIRATDKGRLVLDEISARLI